MPARHHVLAIAAFWLAMTSWLVYRDIWPRLRQGGTPHFTIDLTDEASEQTIRWTVYVDAEEKGYARTWVKYAEAEDAYEIHGECKLWFQRRQPLDPDQEFHGKYLVTRDGELVAIDARIQATILGIEVTAHVGGRVVGNGFEPRLEATGRTPGLTGETMRFERTLPRISVANRGSVLSPMQPLNRIRGLRPGQQWNMPLFDPMKAAAERFLPGTGGDGSGTTVVFAEVSSQPEPLPEVQVRNKPHAQQISRRAGTPCWVISYTSDDVHGRTWVRASDSVVLRQEMTRHGETMIFDRD
jgi:hypothetical protein